MSLNLSWAQVRTWRLQQQHLAQRAPHAQMLDVVSRICGLHAQVMSAATLALWARVDEVRPDEVATALWTERTLVKLWAMRGTLHLLPASDVPLYVAAAQATRFGYTRPSWQKYHGVTAAEMTAIIEAARTVLTAQPMTRAEFAAAVIAQTGSETLGDALRSGWGAALKPASYHGYLCFGPSQGQNVTLVQTQRWLDNWQEVETEAAVAEVLRRYLHVYGPASSDNFAGWWGVERAMGKKLWRQVSDELVEVDVEGWRGWALASDVAALQQAAPAAHVRLLPMFDPYIVATPRQSSAVVPAAYKSRIYRQAGWISAVVLVNGVVAGVWQYNQGRNRTSVLVEPFAPLGSEVEALIASEVARLGQFLGSPTELAFGKLTATAPESDDAGI